METAFNIYKVESKTIIDSEGYSLKIHGRALKHLRQNQVLYIDGGAKFSAKIVRIVTYGIELSEIEPMMSCSLEIISDQDFPESPATLFS